MSQETTLWVHDGTPNTLYRFTFAEQVLPLILCKKKWKKWERVEIAGGTNEYGVLLLYQVNIFIERSAMLGCLVPLCTLVDGRQKIEITMGHFMTAFRYSGAGYRIPTRTDIATQPRRKP